METLEKASEYELIDHFLSRKEPESRNAFRVLHNRYKDFLTIITRQWTSTSFPRQWEKAAEDIVQDTWERVFLGISKFKKENGLSSEKQAKHFKTWLYRIAENAYIDYYRKFYHQMDDIDEVVGIAKFVSYEEGTEALVKTLPKASKGRHDRILKAVEVLTEKETEILRAYVRYGKIDDEDHWTLDPEVLSNLSKKYGVTPNAIQQSKRRIIEKLREILKV